MLKKAIGLGLLSVFFAVSAVNISAKVVDKTLAIVNGEAIMSSEYEEILVPVMEQYSQGVPKSEQTPEKITELKQRLLDQMIDDRLAKQEAKKKKIKVPKREVDQAISQIKQRFPSESDFNAELKKGNLTTLQFEKRIEEQLMVMKLMDTEVKSKTKTPGEAEIKEFYAKIQKKIDGKNLGLNKQEEEELAALAKLFKRASAEKVRASHILIRADRNATQPEKAAALKKAQDIKGELAKGAEFEDLAKKYSEDPGTKDLGGDLGFFSYDDMVPEFAKSAFSLNVGQVSGTVLTDFGYHIIKVQEKRAAKKLSFDEMKNDIQDFIFQKEAQKLYEQWMKNLRASSNIKKNPIE